MKCARCGHPSQGASWYCANCGAELGDLNVADSGKRRPLPPLLRWSLWLTAAALGMIVLAALAIGLSRRGEQGSVLDALREAQGEPSSPEPGTPAAGGGGDPARGRRTPTTASSGAGPRSTSAAPSGARATYASPPGIPRRAAAPPWPIERVEVPPAIDGRLEDWGAPFTLAEPLPLSKVVFGTENWDGRADLSAEALLAWDPAALYLGVRVLDDIFSQPSSGDLLFRGDSLELQLDVDLAQDFESGSYSDDDWQLGISPGELTETGRGPEAWVWRPEARSGAADFPIAARRLDDGYVVEAAIPWLLFGLDPVGLQAIGFALNVSDNDLPSPEQLSMVSSSPERLWGDPRSFGVLVFER